MKNNLILRKGIAWLLCIAILMMPASTSFATKGGSYNDLNSDIYSMVNIDEWHKEGYLGDGLHIVILDRPVDVEFYRKEFGANVSNFGHSYREDSNSINAGHGNIVFDTMFQVAPNAKYTILPSGLTGLNLIEEINEDIDIVNSSYDRLFGARKLSSYIDEGTVVFKSGGNIKYGGLVESGYNEIRDIAINVSAVSKSIYSKGGVLYEPYYTMVTPTIDVTGFTNVEVRVPGGNGEISTYHPSGTSISAPLVAAMTALYKQKFMEENDRSPSISETRGFIKDNSVPIKEFVNQNGLTYSPNNSKYKANGEEHSDYTDKERYGDGIFVLPNPSRKIGTHRKVNERLNKEWNQWDQKTAKMKKIRINQDSINKYFDEKNEVLKEINDLDDYVYVNSRHIDSIIKRHRSDFDFIYVDKRDIDDLIDRKKTELSSNKVNAILSDAKAYIEEYEDYLVEHNREDVDLINKVLNGEESISIQKARELEVSIRKSIKEQLISTEKERTKEVIYRANKINLIDKTEDSRNNLKKFINIAEATLNKSNDVEALQYAARDLEEAIDSMQLFDGYLELRQTLNDAKSINTKNKTQHSIDNLNQAIKNTNYYINHEMSELKIESLVEQLKNAINNLKDIEDNQENNINDTDSNTNIEFITDRPVDEPIENIDDIKDNKNINIIEQDNLIEHNSVNNNSSSSNNSSSNNSSNNENKTKGVIPLNLKGEIDSDIVSNNLPYIKGYQDNTFRPNKNITKEEALLILNRIFFDGEKTVGGNITNNGSRWSKDEINNLIFKNVIENNYDVKKEMTREEFIEIVIKAIYGEKFKTSYKTNLKDVNSNKYTLKALELNIIKGFGDNTFKGNKPMTRAEFITIINKIIKRDELRSKDMKFKDIKSNHWYYQEILKAV